MRLEKDPFHLRARLQRDAVTGAPKRALTLLLRGENDLVAEPLRLYPEALAQREQ